MAERKFRDGTREVPDYIHDMMQGLETRKLSYEEALVAMNKKALSDHVNKAVDRIVTEHFIENLR